MFANASVFAMLHSSRQKLKQANATAIPTNIAIDTNIDAIPATNTPSA